MMKFLLKRKKSFIYWNWNLHKKKKYIGMIYQNELIYETYIRAPKFVLFQWY